MKKKSFKRRLEEKIAKKAIENVFYENTGVNMKDFLKFVKGLLDELPFNNNKSDIGQVVFYLSMALDIWDQLVPVLLTVEKFVPPHWAAGIGALIVLVGKIHQMLKKMFPDEIPDLKSAK